MIARLRAVDATCERGRWGKLECSSQNPYTLVIASIQIHPKGGIDHVALRVSGLAVHHAWPRIDAVINGLVSDDARAALFNHLADPRWNQRFDDYEVSASHQPQGNWSVYEVGLWWPR